MAKLPSVQDVPFIVEAPSILPEIVPEKRDIMPETPHTFDAVMLVLVALAYISTMAAAVVDAYGGTPYLFALSRRLHLG